MFHLKTFTISGQLPFCFDVFEHTEWNVSEPESCIIFWFLSQPGCVNTTEMDIRKCRREKNPHRVKKVRAEDKNCFTFVCNNSTRILPISFINGSKQK